MSRDRFHGQKGYGKDDERRLRQEMLEGEVQRQKTYSKEDEKALREELEQKPGDDKSDDDK